MIGEVLIEFNFVAKCISQVESNQGKLMTCKSQPLLLLIYTERCSHEVLQLSPVKNNHLNKI